MTKKLFVGSIAALVVGVLGVTPALAQAESPEIGRCLKKAKAEGVGYSNAGCTTTGIGAKAKFEWQPGVVKGGFTSSEETTTFETAKGVKITCKTALDHGELTGPKTDTESITLTGCESSGIKCNSPGQVEGTVVTNSLKSLIGYINKAKKEVGVDLEGTSSPTFAEFDCGAISVAISGSVIAKVTPVNKMTSVFNEAFTQTKGKQKPEKLEHAAKDTLSCKLGGGPAEQCGFTSKDTVVTEEKVETRVIPEPKWWVEGGLLGGSEPLAEETVTVHPFRLVLTQEKGAVEVGTLECPKVKLIGASIQAPSGRSETATEYLECKVLLPASMTENPQCEVENRKIVTNEMKATLEGALGAEKLRFEPKSGNEIAGFEIVGASCSFKGKFRANGVMICGYEEVEIEKPKHPLEFSETSGTQVTLTGPTQTKPNGITVTYEDSLASGKLYSAF